MRVGRVLATRPASPAGRGRLQLKLGVACGGDRLGLLEEALDLVRHEVPAREKFVMIDAWEACYIVSMYVLSHTMAQERGGEADGRVPAMSLNREMSQPV